MTLMCSVSAPNLLLCGHIKHDFLFPHLVFGWSTAVVRLVSQFLSVCLVVSRGSTTGSSDDVQPRIVHSDCGVTIKVTSFAPI